MRVYTSSSTTKLWLLIVVAIISVVSLCLFIIAIILQQRIVSMQARIQSLDQIVAAESARNKSLNNLLLNSSQDRDNRPRYNGSPPDSISIRPGQIILARNQERLVAFRIIDGWNEATYEYWSTNNLDEFSLSTATHGTGELSKEDGKFQLCAGSLCVEWSAGNHVYPHGYRNFSPAPVEITATPWNEPEEIDIGSSALWWIGNARAGTNPR